MEKILFNDSWQVSCVDVEINKDFNCGKSNFYAVSIPHDYTTEQPFDKTNPSGNNGAYVMSTILWYRKFFTLDENAPKNQFLYFDGVYNNATVYINGNEAGFNAYGYSSFCVDISDYVQAGLNIVAVKVDGSKEPSSRWFNGLGINRNVWHMQANDTFVKNNGVYINTEKLNQADIELTIVSSEVTTDIEVQIFDKEQKLVNSTKQSCSLTQGENTVNLSLDIENPEYWSTENPTLYTCVIKVANDTSKVKFGIRSLEFIPNQGFFINGVNTKFKGVCLHHDGGCVGSAVPTPLWRKRILMLKEMGCNAIRTAHNPFNPEFYDLCDEIGMMVMDEAFDGWDIPKAKHDYGTIWADNYKKDLTNFILRDRNHPSIVMWSIGNEVLKMNTEITKELMSIIKSLDTTRKITSGINSVNETSDSNRAILDVAGYNDGGGACFIYEDDHIKRPEQLMVATEAPHSFQTRGYYRTKTWWRDKNQPRLEIENLTEEEIFFDQNADYNSSYDNSGVRTCARDSWSIAERLPYLCGEFRWTGFDYVGEAFYFNWPTRTHSFGVIDLANFPKDHYYLYQSMWTDKKMVHLLPHWTHRYMEKGTEIPVWVYTNCEEAELFLNGESLGKKALGDAKNLEWLVPYTEGTLTVKVYENGEIIAEKSHITANTPSKIVYSCEVLPSEDEVEIAQLSIEIQDDKSNFVPYSNNLTGIYLSHACKLLGSDNGAIDDMSHWKTTQRRAFNGLLMYLVQYPSTKENVYAITASILGNEYFDNSTTVTLDVKQYDLTKSSHKDVKIYYTVNGANADENATAYTGAFEISETSIIKMAVYVEDEKIIEIEDIFVKGRPEPVIDLNHLNHEVKTDRPTGPFDAKIVGTWTDGGADYIFKDDGVLVRKMGFQETKIAYWWYDFPADFLESPDYAGAGELWYVSGEIEKIELKDQKSNELIIHNEQGAVGTAYSTSKDMVWTKK